MMCRAVERLVAGGLSLLFFVFLVGCGEPLVHEEYAVTSYQSINGLDLFEEMMAEKGAVTHSAFADEKRLREADLIVYVQKAPYLHAGELESIRQALRSVTDRSGVNEASGILSESAGGLNLLILQRGLSSSPAFWTRLLSRFPDDEAHARVRSYIEGRLDVEGFLSRLPEASYFYRRTVLSGGFTAVPVEYHPLDRLAFLFEPGRLPSTIPAAMKILSEELPENELPENGATYRRTIIAVENGAFFSEAALPGAHLFLVSDATPFLNYHLARPENRTLLDFVLDRSLKYTRLKEKPKILILEGWNTKQEEMQKERSLWTFFLRPPWNVPAVLLAVLFGFFVWSRLIREQPVIETEVEDRDGDLLRHFRGIADLLVIARRKREKISLSEYLLKRKGKS